MLTNTMIRILYAAGGFLSGVVLTGVVGCVFKDKIENFVNGESDDVEPVNVEEVNID